MSYTTPQLPAGASRKKVESDYWILSRADQVIGVTINGKDFLFPAYTADAYGVAGLAGPDGELLVQYDDLRFPAQGINPAGSAAPPAVDSTVLPGTLLFSGTSTNVVAGVAQLPHEWRRGSPVHPHIHWAKTTSAAGGVVWQFCYALADVAETFGTYSVWETLTHLVPDADTANRHALSSAAEIDLSAYKESAIILWQLRRKPDDAGDTYAADARLLEFDIHYQVSKNGTNTEIPGG